ncbi:hypothetical protein [Paenibacillus massiliensis]|uniref:hypothetical protein n=1 Tax=Paenibacillus massiliensis TaxID=225917 RepID=UPI00048B8FDD|nr:hypothetical protein [Paenibacillus massiliensis]
MKRSSIQRTTKSLLNMRDRIRFDLLFQRNSVWKNDRQSYSWIQSYGIVVSLTFLFGITVMVTFGSLMGGSVGSLTKADRNRYVDEQLIWQFIAPASKHDIDFGGASLNQFISNLDEVPAPVTELIEHKIDFMDAAFRNWDHAQRKVLRKVHVGSLFQVVDYALENSWSEDQFGSWAESFLIDQYSVDNPYGQLCQKGTTNKGFVAKRLALMSKDMEQFPLQMELPNL